MIKHIFFDFDGVLVESVKIKTEAFRQLYLPFGKEISDAVVEHHLQNGGISRFEKFRLYHEKWLNIKVDEALMENLEQHFSSLVLNGVVKSPEVNGTSDFLKKNRNVFKFWLITGTPTKEIKVILEKRKMAHFFVGVFGSPTQKKEWSEYIINKEKLDRDSIVFVGNALADYAAANHSKIRFILRETEENIALFEFFLGPRIKDMTVLAETIYKLTL